MPSPGSRLQRAAAKETRLCVGLMSGTSVDAVEAALCEVRGSGEALALKLIAHSSVPYEPELAARILSAQTVRDVCELNFLVAEAFAQAARAVISKAGLTPEQVDLVGSHGQTLAHLPAPQFPVPSTLQVGEAAVIAERTGIPTISDFRTRDMAAGGQGAPLVPYADWAMFRVPGAFRALQNLGGIGNLTVVSTRLEDTVAFDTGPGNMILDALAIRVTEGKLRCDRDGVLSARGEVLPELLAELLSHPFLTAEPPKSTGREQFGEAFASGLWERYRHRPYDLMATAAAFTVEATARAYERWVLPRFALEGLYVSGGGGRNPTLMNGLTRRLGSLRVLPLAALGFPEEAKEAASFALLASECLSHAPQNVPSATGARKSVVLGKMVP